MRPKTSKRVLALAALGAAAVLVIFAVASRNPVLEWYHVRKAEESSGTERRHHVKALMEMGSGACVPYLLEDYETNPILLRVTSRLETVELRVRELHSIGPVAVPYLARAVKSRGPGTLYALLALQRFGPAASPALPALIDILRQARSGDLRHLDEAIDTLAAIGAGAHPAVPDLLACLDTDREIQRWSIYGALEDIGPRAAAAVPKLLAALEQEQGERRVQVASALESIVPGRPEVVPALIRSLRDESPTARYNAAAFLGSFGSRASAALPALLQLTREEPEEEVARAAAGAVHRIEADAAGNAR